MIALYTLTFTRYTDIITLYTLTFSTDNIVYFNLHQVH